MWESDLANNMAVGFEFGIADLGKTFTKRKLPREYYHWAIEGLHLSRLGLRKLKESINNYIHRVKVDPFLKV